MNKKKILRFSYEMLIIILGNFIYAFGVMAFIEQNQLITGGITGLSLFIHYLTGFSTSIFVWIFNIVFFLLGLFTLGKKFALTTLASTIIYPICITILEFIPLAVFKFDEMWVNILCAGILIGLGLGLVMRVGSSTGGFDILAILLNKKFKYLSLGLCITAFDIISISAQIFGDGVSLIEVVYGLIMMVIYSFTIDRVVLLGRDKLELKIVSSKHEEIRNAILNDIDRGVTLIHSKTGYLNNETDLVLTVIGLRELNRIQNLIHSVDSDAFIVVTQVKEVKGRGFTEEQIHLNKNNEK